MKFILSLHLLASLSSVLGSQYFDISRLDDDEMMPPHSSTNSDRLNGNKYRGVGDVEDVEDVEYVEYFHPIGHKKVRIDTSSRTPAESLAPISFSASASASPFPCADFSLAIPSPSSAGAGKAKPKARTFSRITGSGQLSMVAKRDQEGAILFFDPSSTHAEIIESSMKWMNFKKEEYRQAMARMLEIISADDTAALNTFEPEFKRAFKSPAEYSRCEFKSFLSRFFFLFGSVKIFDSYYLGFVGPDIQSGLINMDCWRYLLATKSSSTCLGTLMRFRSYFIENGLLEEAMKLFLQTSPPLNYFQRIVIDNYKQLDLDSAKVFANDSKSELDCFSAMFNAFHSKQPANNAILLKVFDERSQEFFGQCKDHVQIFLMRALFIADRVDLVRKVYQCDPNFFKTTYLKHKYPPYINFLPNDTVRNLLDMSIENDAKECFKFMVQALPSLLTDVTQNQFSTLSLICDENKQEFLNIISVLDINVLDAQVLVRDGKSYDLAQYAFFKCNRPILEYLCEKFDKDEILGRIIFLWGSTEEAVIHSILNCAEASFIYFSLSLAGFDISMDQTHYSFFCKPKVAEMIRTNGIPHALNELSKSSNANSAGRPRP